METEKTVYEQLDAEGLGAMPMTEVVVEQKSKEPSKLKKIGSKLKKMCLYAISAVGIAILVIVTQILIMGILTWIGVYDATLEKSIEYTIWTYSLIFKLFVGIAVWCGLMKLVYIIMNKIYKW